MNGADGHNDGRDDSKRRKVDLRSSWSDSEVSVDSDSGVHSDASGDGSLSSELFAMNHLDLVIDVSHEVPTNAFPALVVEVVNQMPVSEQKKAAQPVEFSPIKKPNKPSEITSRTAAKIDAGAKPDGPFLVGHALP